MDRFRQTVQSRIHLGFSGWLVLVAATVMFLLHLCRHQGKMHRLSEWDFFLQGAGKILVLSDDVALLRTAATGAEMLPWDRFPKLRKLAEGNNVRAFTEGLAKAGIRLVIVPWEGRVSTLHSGRTGKKGPGPASIVEVLSNFKPIDGLHPLMIGAKGAIYEAKGPPAVRQDELQALVRLVRKQLELGRPSKTAYDLSATSSYSRRRKGSPLYEVAVQLQGLKPAEGDRKGVTKTRRDLVASGRGESMEEATIKAAEGIASLFDKRFAATEGPLKKALSRYTIELHLLYEFTLVDHLIYDLDDVYYSRYLDSVFIPGVHGIYVNRPVILEENEYLSPLRPRMRLPPDSIYWMRGSGKKLVERVATDINTGGLKGLARNDKITIDRFRTLHVAESSPGGDVVVLTRGLPEISLEEVNLRNLKEWGGAAAGWLERAVKDGGQMAVVYLPDRDSEKFEEPTAITWDASYYLLALMALQEAAHSSGEERLKSAFKKGLGHVALWLMVCPKARVAKEGSEEGGGGWQVLPFCGPVSRTGSPVSVKEWGQGGKEPKKVPQDLIFLYGNTRVTLKETALLGLLLARELETLEDERQRAILEGIVDFVLFMQRSDGTFQSYFVDEKNAFYRSDDPGGGFIALTLLLRARDLLKDRRIGPAAAKALPTHLKKIQEEVEKLQQGVLASTGDEGQVMWVLAWGLASMSAAATSLKDNVLACKIPPLALGIIEELQLDSSKNPLVERGLDGGFVLRGKEGVEEGPDFRSVMMTWALAEVVAAALQCRCGSKGPLLAAARRGMRFASSLQLRSPGRTLFVPNPARADGGVMQSLTIMRQRIDYSAWMVLATTTLLKRLGEKE